MANDCPGCGRFAQPGEPCDCTVVDIEALTDAIESLKNANTTLWAKLFRERAARYRRRGIDPISFDLPDGRWVMVPYDKAADRFERVAHRIEKGKP